MVNQPGKSSIFLLVTPRIMVHMRVCDVAVNNWSERNLHNAKRGSVMGDIMTYLKMCMNSRWCIDIWVSYGGHPTFALAMRSVVMAQKWGAPGSQIIMSLQYPRRYTGCRKRNHCDIPYEFLLLKATKVSDAISIYAYAAGVLLN